jgi:hypothetical protein
MTVTASYKGPSESPDKVVVETLPCLECGERSTLTVDRVGWALCEAQHVQEAFPDMSAGDRELLITGTHPECWERIFADDGEDGLDGQLYESLGNEEEAP